MTSNSKYRVLQIGKYYPPQPGGIETHLELLCGELRKSIDVQVLVAGNRWRTTRENPADGLELIRLATPFRLAATPICPQMASMIRQSGPDLVHIHFPNPWAVLAFFISRWRGPLIVTWHSDIVRQRVLGATLRPLLKKFLGRAAAVIATSGAYAQSSPMLSAVTEKVRIVPHGIPEHRYRFCDTAAIAQIRERYGPKIVLGVGRLVYYKGWDYLLRAFRQVPDARLLIIGEGPLLNSLRRQVDEHQLGRRVAFLGRVPDTLPYYHACDVFVLASTVRSEAFGIVQLEAMACGKPVVNTALDSGVTFVSPPNVTGLTVPPADSAALASAINLLLENPTLREQYGRMGVRRVRQNFSLEKMVRATLALYGQTLGESPSAPPIDDIQPAQI